MNITPVIMCGGSGSRLWPLSRDYFPKQFLNLGQEKTLFKETLLRIAYLEKLDVKIDKIIIVTNEKQRFIVLDQYIELGLDIKVEIILEPEPKNTAPALTLAALSSIGSVKNSILIVTPSDHLINDHKAFAQNVRKSITHLQNNEIFTLGVLPKSPSISYGYIEYSGNHMIKDVTGFFEKPTKEKAMKYSKNGNYAWNSGVFIMTAQTWLSAISKVDEIYSPLKLSWMSKEADNFFIRPNSKYFEKVFSDSIDYAVLEKHNIFNISIKMLILSSDWNDLGTFKSLSETFRSDLHHNRVSGDVLTFNSSFNIVKTSKKMVALYNIKNTVVIESDDVVLIADRDSSDDIKNFLSQVKKIKPDLLKFHNNVHRPWGSFDLIYENEICKVKKIIIKPSHEISYQSHKYRSEHWVVVKGQAFVNIEGKKKYVNENESVFIPMNTKHQLSNKGKENLQIIELQTGKVLSEDDIVRYSDPYNR